jgi:hypothetical protein
VAVTADDVEARYMNQLHQSNIPVPAYAHGLAPVALAQAQEDVRSILGGLGYTPLVLQSWPGYDSTVTLQSLFWMGAVGAILDSGASGRLIKALLDTLDQRPALKGATLFDSAGEYLPVLRGISHGVIKHHPMDAFTADDGRRGGAGSWKPW